MPSRMNAFTLAERKGYRLVFALLFGAVTVIAMIAYGARLFNKLHTIGKCLLWGLGVCRFAHGCYFATETAKGKRVVGSFRARRLLCVIISVFFLPCYLYNLLRIGNESNK